LKQVFVLSRDWVEADIKEHFLQWVVDTGILYGWGNLKSVKQVLNNT
jgi:hypothetical protein